ncbi:Bifunctional inhibitor/plant lipid transfer protein/seed storage helical domain containing protein [Parasponia andersonii]|uniref:Bifunctional inhibitor/plant lipid transfer protein/seed storage helical domain containing protein n=1 Tax=Parasponia andersonii TaxID=3476 RepID=A0A2P5C662_PARAD|nr:Bifunctional inhibitor/plant lipid transfer protein/seed storage helical domain containing protein [Parasponia andersonii]
MIDVAANRVRGNNIEAVVYSLAPCAAAVQSTNVPVPHNCCNQLTKIDKSRLCAIILSKEAEILGLKPEVAVTVPKRCNFANRLAGTTTKHE